MTSADNVSERGQGSHPDTRVRVGTVPAQAGSPDRQDRPGQPRVFRNDYAPLTPPRLGEWTPTLSVSVVIPAHGHQDKLDLVLASLAAQSYPAHLMEVVVVDDGSPEPLTLPRVRPGNTLLVPSAPGGWGSAHAVNTGAAASSGQVILRLDADMLVYREHVESQMRWHHLVDYAVVMGHKMFVDFDPAAMAPEYVYEEVAAGRAETLFDLRGADPHWVERFIDRTDRLRSAHHEAFKVFVGATGSLHRTLFDAAGGLDPSLVLGGDSEFGHRVAQQGAVFVPDLDTSSWHLGRSQMQERRDAGTRYRMPYVSNRVPDFHLRRKRPERLWEVPLVDVVLDVAGHPEIGFASRRIDHVHRRLDRSTSAALGRVHKIGRHVPISIHSFAGRSATIRLAARDQHEKFFALTPTLEDRCFSSGQHTVMKGRPRSRKREL